MAIDIFGDINGDLPGRLAEVQEGETIRLSSSGGDVFAAIASYNLLKDKGVTIEIVGLAASAASIIAAAGKVVRMTSNAAIMLHNPAVSLNGFYTAADLERQAAGLKAAESSIIRCYSTRLTAEVARELLDRETWLTAEEAKSYGLVDEIIEPLLATALTTSIRAEESKRLRELVALKGAGSTSDALVETAMVEGLTAAQVQPFLSAIKKVPVAAELTAVIRDQMTSGAAGVLGSTGEDARAAQLKRIIDYANATR